MIRRRRGLATGTALAALLLVTACEQGPTDPADGATTQDPAPGRTDGAHTTATGSPGEGDEGDETGTTAGSHEAEPVDDEQVHAALLAMDDALQAGDVEAYLRHVSPDLQQEQRAWFQGVTSAPLDVHELRLDGVVSQRGCVSDDEPCLDGGTVVHVGLRHRFTGAEPAPVLEQYRWVLADLGDDVPVLVESRGRDGLYYGYPQLWDLGEPLTVLEGHHVSLLVQRSRAAEAETLLDTLDLAAENTLAELPWVGAGRERLVVQLAPTETIEEHGWAEESTGSVLFLHTAPEELPREPGRLSARGAPVQEQLFLDLDLALVDLEDFGLSPGGQTELRYIAAYAATWGDDPEAWPEDWILSGPAFWWSAADDPNYAENLRFTMGEHFALAGPPQSFPLSPPDQQDAGATEAFLMESLALTTYLEEAYGRAALVELVGLLIPLDQLDDADQIEAAYQETLGVHPEELIEGLAEWTEELPTYEDELGPPPQGR